MSTQLKHILIAFLFGSLAQLAQALVPVVPVTLQPFVSAAVTYFTHYYLENSGTGTSSPASPPALPFSAPPTAPPAPPANTTSPTPAPAQPPR